MAHTLAYLECQVPPGSRAAGVAISRARWHDEGDSHWSQRTPAISSWSQSAPVRVVWEWTLMADGADERGCVPPGEASEGAEGDGG